MKALDFLLTVATFIAFVIAVYIFSTDPTITKSINWAEDRVSQDETLPPKAAVTTSNNALLKQENSSINKDYPSNTVWKYIVLHHSATKQGNARIFDNYHRKEKGMKEGLAYHFVIGNGIKSKDGAIEIGNRWKKQIPGEHCWDAKMNQQSIGICLVGNFDESKPTSKQIESLTNLISNLQKQYRIPPDKILVHREVDKNRTNCPGKYFPVHPVRNVPSQ
ncbi:MAG: peptidoglycan recognition family protein [Planctomycetota bacterium]